MPDFFKFTVAESLRVTWFVAQRADPALFELCKNPEGGKGFRLASDGLLEKCVILKDKNYKFVPVVPAGNATVHLVGDDGYGFKTISEF